MDISVRAINEVRMLCADIIQKANSGHPGAAMGCSPIAFALWGSEMNFSPSNPNWSNRDRFVLSNGHACALQYSMLHLTGYNVTLDDLKEFRQVGSKTPGHPENFLTEGVEVSTGPLGQGISNAVGMALASRHAAAEFNKPGFPLVEHFVYVICGDGCMQEGVASEASSLAGHLGLGNLIVLYDDNSIQIDGSTDLAFTEDVSKRYEAYGWHIQHVENGNDDVDGIISAIAAAKEVKDKPSFIKVTTVIGFGSSRQGTAKIHGSPLGLEDLANTKKKFGLDPSSTFNISDEVYEFFKNRGGIGNELQKQWEDLFSCYKEKYPVEAAEFLRRQQGKLPDGWRTIIPTYSENNDATRKTSMKALQNILPKVPEMIGGSADLTPSNLTKTSAVDVDFQRNSPIGRYIRFGVREHGMAALCNGIAAYGGYIPFCATFLNFTGYALGSVRLSALSKFRVIYVMTHDSIGLGEDGPTHQPVEMINSLRSMPNMFVFRPCDGNEVAGCYAHAIEMNNSPSVLALSRQGCPILSGSDAEKVSRGAYVLQDCPNPKIILVGTGYEVGLCVDAKAFMANIAVRIVSFPCWELFEDQSDDYKNSVFLEGVPTLSVEAASRQGWERYAHGHISLERFGMSGPGPQVLDKLGFNAENVAAKAKALIDFYPDRAPSLRRPSL
eukprot:UC4_evm2s526